MATHLYTYLQFALGSEQTLADSLRSVGRGHTEHPDVVFTCEALAAMSQQHADRLAPVVERYGDAGGPTVTEPERLHADGVGQTRSGPVGLLRDLQDLHLLATLTQTTWTVIGQGAQGLRDGDLLQISLDARADIARQIAWFTTRMKAAAPQALIVSS